MDIRTTDTADDVVNLTLEEVRRVVDAEARDRLGISGEEFLRQLKQGTLADTLATHEIAIVASLLDGTGRVVH